PVVLPGMRTEADRTERRLFDTRPNVSNLSISAKDLTSAPRFFAEADVLRSMQLMPGVEARNDFTAGMNVRGGEADQNLVLLDGYPVYNPFHFGGLFGTFIDPAVGRVDMLTGAFPSQFGGRLSSVLNVRSAEDDRPGVHGTSEVSLIASTLSLGGALGANGSWLVAGRRTYADQAINLVKKNAFPYHFFDLESHLAYTLPGALRLSATAYGGDDLLHVDASGGDQSQRVVWGNHVIGTTLSRAFSGLLGDSLVAEQRVSESRFRLATELSGGGLSLNSNVRDLRAAGSITAFGSHTHRLGYEIAGQQLEYSVNYPIPLFPPDSLRQRVRSVSGYVDELWRLTPSLMVQGGVRYDGIAGLRGGAAEPRLSIKYFVNKDLALTVATGEYTQWIRSLAREDIPLRPVDYWIGTDSLTPPSRAWHYVLGVERWVTPSRSFRVEGFYKRYSRLLEPNPFADPQVQGDEFLPVKGWSTGADLLLRQFESPGGRFSGWLSYTYTLNRRVDSTGYRFFPSQDRRHDVNLVGSWHFPKYTLAARFNLATGTPYTRMVGEFDRLRYDPLRGGYTTHSNLPDLIFLTGPRNGERLPLSQRLDVSVTRNFVPGKISVTPYLSVMNVYNAHNVFGYLYNYDDAPPSRISLPQLPVFPTFGLSVSW
ncbi:MAG TPA: TonB-dependent receptor plug domain-containing protein, partial [Gemmatimonadaceae bacterium]|nr:TonB-dependent receptor plug domain-containing protein [Gemmatimonadaceae bacterium]